jgi:hypothetical protein
MWLQTRGCEASGKRITPRFVTPWAVALSSGLLCATLAGAGQTSGVNQGGPEYLHSQAGASAVPQNGASEAATKVEQMRQAERHRRVAADTAKLVELSVQLKTQIDQAPKDQLSLDALRKAAEIEKIAHDLKGWLAS